MMAYHQRVNQFKSRIDFDDPSTTKPPSLAKSAVLQALEEEERQQQGRGKGWLPAQSRPSRSRQREPAPTAAPVPPERSRTPCINRDTVLRINRRPVRHRSCDNYWPPPSVRQSGRSPSPLAATATALGGAEGGSFAYDLGARHYGSHESVYFDERVRKQHKIDPLRTMFDKANVVLVDWGGRNKAPSSAAASGRLSDNGVYDRRRHEEEKVVVGVGGGDDDAGNNSVKQGEMIESEAKPPVPRLPDEEPKPPQQRPPSPPPRRYFLPMEQLQSGVGIEILLRCYGGPPSSSSTSLNQSESQEISTFKIDDGTDSRQQAKQQQPPAFPVFPDGIQSKPPLKSRATPTKRFPSKPPTPVPAVFPVGHVNRSDDPAMSRDEFNINSNTILNLNIDNTSPTTTMTTTTVPQITVTDCRQPRGTAGTVTAMSKTNDQLWHEIIDENHNYNEKLITNSSSSGSRGHPAAPVAEFGAIDDRQRPERPNEQHSKLNVSNQANRNWINLNSNEIYPPSVAIIDSNQPARVTKTRVSSSTDAANDDDPVLTVVRQSRGGVADNYDNKSIKSNYWTDDGGCHGLRRSESRDSSRSWRVDEVLEFPPPPPYLCDCDEDDNPSGRCSEERSSGAQSHENRSSSTPIVAIVRASPRGAYNPTISQSCRQDSTADVCPSFPSCWNDNHTTSTAAAAAATDDYFKTNLTDDKFLNENVNTACNLRGDHSKQRQQQPPDLGQASNPLHKSIDAFLAHERGHGQPDAGSKNSPTDDADHNTHHPTMSFTDGEYIFGPYDERSEEFQHFNLWSSGKFRRNCRHQQCHGAGSDSSSGTTLVPPPHDGSCSCSCSVISSDGTLREEITDEASENESAAAAKTPECRQPAEQVENYDTSENVPAATSTTGNVPSPSVSYHRWVRFENGNICPRRRSPTPVVRVPTPYPSPTLDEADEQIFDQFAAGLKQGDDGGLPEPSLVENVPLIDAVLDDLLTFSKTLRGMANDDDQGEGRAVAKIVEINDDNLINLLTDDDDDAPGGGRRTQANEDFSKATTAGKDSAGSEKSLPSKPPLGSANSDEVDGEKCDRNANEGRERHRHRSMDAGDVSEDNYLNREDIFANVAIFSWNPLDIYQEHGLFMIDPRFALADLHATVADDGRRCNAAIPGQDDRSRKSDDARLNRQVAREQPPNYADGRRPEDDTAKAASSSIGMLALTDGADPSSVDVNSFATQRAAEAADTCPLLESHKIPNDSPRTSPQPRTVDHFYDSAHVEYPVRRRRSDLSSSNATTKECHQSPPPSSSVESDYDNDLATVTKCNPGRDEEEGLKRVAWPPSAEDEYEQVQQQQQQQPPQQQQPYYQQPLQQQQQQAPAYQQQHQPRERIIPIQRPEQQQQQPQYQPQATQAFQPLVSQQQQQQFYHQQPEAFDPPQQQQQHQHQQQYQQPEPVPFFTTLRSEPPMSQEPAPVYQTQPVAAIYQGGSNMRGDQKWPPAEVKKQSELENEERRRLAQEPAFRPRKVQKDYSGFFAKNALNQTYPGYRAPPGTQHHS